MHPDRERRDNFGWVDDLVNRWPVITTVVGLIVWLTVMQANQAAMATEMKGIPALNMTVQDLSNKVEALTEALGYEVKYKAVKKKVVPSEAE